MKTIPCSSITFLLLVLGIGGLVAQDPAKDKIGTIKTEPSES